jgi:hypothetical protein
MIMQWRHSCFRKTIDDCRSSLLGSQYLIVKISNTHRSESQPYIYIITDSFPFIIGILTIIEHGVVLMTPSAPSDKKKNVCRMAENEIEQKNALPRFYWNFP